MSKRPISAKILIADGQGQMNELPDHRFDADDWPISVIISPQSAATWIAHLAAECESRDWNFSGLSQLEPEQNNGSMTIYAPVLGTASAIEVAWEKDRDKQLLVRARPGPLSVDSASEFFTAIDSRLKNGTTQREPCRAWLTYDALPWRGELWLDDNLRLGPPSQFPDTIFGPQIVVVDAMVEGIGWQGIRAKFQRTLFDIRVFLSVVLGCHFAEMKLTNGWAYEIDARGQFIGCRLARLGYVELKAASGFPAAGSAPPIDRRSIARPGVGEHGVTLGITSDMTERWVPDDIEKLWGLYCDLPDDKRDQFIKAGNAHLIAQNMWPDQRTACASFLVVACEALKPKGKNYDEMNVYDVVESLAGAGKGAALRIEPNHPQKVRSKHFHRAGLFGGELSELLINDPFQDPSFGNMLDLLEMYTRTCLIEWLRKKGEYAVACLPRANQSRSSRGRVR